MFSMYIQMTVACRDYRTLHRLTLGITYKNIHILQVYPKLDLFF